MLFNFQGPNLLRCINVFHRNSLFIIACRFEFVKLFFQDFFEPLWLSLSKLPRLAHRLGSYWTALVCRSQTAQL